MTFDMFSESVVLKGDTPFSKCMYLAADCVFSLLKKLRSRDRLDNLALPLCFAYLARFQTASLDTPIDDIGFVRVSSSPEILKVDIRSIPFQFGNELLSM
jgi:hypothetical protein